jgi:ribosomal protein L15
MRGAVSMGHGRVGKHRKHPGGRGLAGGMHHERINMNKYHPGHFGKKGIRHFHLKPNREWTPIVNIDHLWTLVSKQTREAAQKNKDKATVIDATKSVIYIISLILLGLLQGPRKGLSPQDPHRCEMQDYLQAGREEDQGGWRCRRAYRLIANE